MFFCIIIQSNILFTIIYIKLPFFIAKYSYCLFYVSLYILRVFLFYNKGSLYFYELNNKLLKNWTFFPIFDRFNYFKE